MSRPRLILVLIALLLALPAPLRAQEGGPLDAEQAALVERVRVAVAAAAEYPSGTATLSGTSSDSTEMTLGDAIFPAHERRSFEAVTHFTRDANGRPVRQVLEAVEVTREEHSQAQAYTLTAELRVVDGTLYVLATRESADPSGLPPMPEGWIAVARDADWPALEALLLADRLADVDRLDLFDRDTEILLAHVSAAESRADLREDGRPVDVITLSWDAPALGAALAEVSAAAGGSSGLAAAYAALDAASTLSMEFVLDATPDAGAVILLVDTRMRVVLNEVSLLMFSTQAPADGRLSLVSTLRSTLTIADIGAPAEPVLAPDLP